MSRDKRFILATDDSLAKRLVLARETKGTSMGKEEKKNVPMDDSMDKMVNKVKRDALGASQWGQEVDEIMKRAPAQWIGAMQSVRYPKHTKTSVEQGTRMRPLGLTAGGQGRRTEGHSLRGDQDLFQSVTLPRLSANDLVFGDTTRKLLESIDVESGAGAGQRALMLAIEDLLGSTYRIRIRDCMQVVTHTNLWMFLLTRCTRLTELDVEASSQDWFGAGQGTDESVRAYATSFASR